jgi:diguanylate cyclase (GGDEF)-like protein
MIHERLERALRRSKRQGHSVALLFIDLDGFKLVNDSHGHQAGDELLKTIAQRLVDHVRPGDTIGRLGGDEFVVLCDHVESPATVANLADRLNDLLREPVELSGRRLFATASIGLALGHGTTHSADELLRNADAAMYQAKEQGRDGWRFFSEEIHEQARQRLDITNGLRQAIERDEFQVRFQPILCAQSQIIRGAELLLRWFPSGGEVSPAHFIPIAEMSGSIVPIGKWVFHQACLAERQWRDRFGIEAPYVSVNVSARQLNDDTLVEEFRDMLAATGADPERIVLELTETSLMSDVIFNLSVLNQLAGLGLRVAVDDFGTGYSSLAQLLRLPLSKLKIDREFVDGLDKRHDSRAIVHAVCSMARAMNLKVIAEGVENASQFGYLRDLGCDYVQGFHFYRPLPPEDFLTLLHESSAAGRLAASDDLYSLLYVSQAARPMDESELEALLAEARESNRAQGITGFLIYFNGSFMQIIEGQRLRIQALVERIRRDPRHQGLRIVFEGGIPQRAFVGWSMGFRDMEHITHARFLRGRGGRAIDFLDMAEDPRVCYNFIAAFAPDASQLPASWDGGRDDPRR